MFKQMENIGNFLKGCRALGVPSFDCFETLDLFDEKNMTGVLRYGLRLVLDRMSWAGLLTSLDLRAKTTRLKHTPNPVLSFSPPTSPPPRNQPTAASTP